MKADFIFLILEFTKKNLNRIFHCNRIEYLKESKIRIEYSLFTSLHLVLNSSRLQRSVYIFKLSIIACVSFVLFLMSNTAFFGRPDPTKKSRDYGPLIGYKLNVAV